MVLAITSNRNSQLEAAVVSGLGFWELMKG